MIPPDMEMIKVRGCITQEKFILNQTPKEMERILGLPQYSLKDGALIFVLTKLPSNNQFSLAKSYTQVAQNPTSAKAENAGLFTPEEIEIEKRIMKRDPLDNLKTMARNEWSVSGRNRLVKVKARKAQTGSGMTYSPGSGVPQWILDEEIESKLVATLAYQEKYIVIR